MSGGKQLPGGGFPSFARIVDVEGLGQAVAFKQRDSEGCPSILLNFDSVVGIVAVTMSFHATEEGQAERDEAYENLTVDECRAVMQQMYMKIAEAAAQATQPQIILPPGVQH